MTDTATDTATDRCRIGARAAADIMGTWIETGDALATMSDTRLDVAIVLIDIGLIDGECADDLRAEWTRRYDTAT